MYSLLQMKILLIDIKLNLTGSVGTESCTSYDLEIDDEELDSNRCVPEKRQRVASNIVQQSDYTEK